jgi:hypothetical protein
MQEQVWVHYLPWNTAEQSSFKCDGILRAITSDMIVIIIDS